DGTTRHVGLKGPTTKSRISARVIESAAVRGASGLPLRGPRRRRCRSLLRGLVSVFPAGLQSDERARACPKLVGRALFDIGEICHDVTIVVLLLLEAPSCNALSVRLQ